MAKCAVLRMTTTTYTVLKAGLSLGKTDDEQFAFGLCSRAEGRNTTLYLMKEVLLPDAGDLSAQGPAGVAPTRAFQTTAYCLAERQRRSIMDAHTHPFQQVPRLSGIDDHEGRRNADFVRRYLPPETTMLMVVFNSELKCFDGRALEKQTGEFRQIDEIQVLGKNITLIPRAPQTLTKADQRFARHLLIPGWDQGKLGRLKIVLAGLGGNGARILEGLVGLGVGRNGGWIAAFDPDGIEASNLSRIPYAHRSDTGRFKTVVTKRFAVQKDPSIPLYAFPFGIEDPRALPFVKEAHVLIGAVDRDTVRVSLTLLSLRYLIPLLDVAAEIIPGKDRCQAAGQIRLVEPGSTACLVCGGGLELSEVDLSALSEEDRDLARRSGYIRGLEETPTPSVLDLNGVTSHLALSHLRRMVFGEPLDGKEYVLYDRQTCSITAASLPQPDPDCPACGLMGVIGRGDEEDEKPKPQGEKPEMLRMKDGQTTAPEPQPAVDPASVEATDGSEQGPNGTRLQPSPHEAPAAGEGD